MLRISPMPSGRGSAAWPGCPIASLMSRPPVARRAGRVRGFSLGRSAKAHANRSLVAPTGGADKGLGAAGTLHRVRRATARLEPVHGGGVEVGEVVLGPQSAVVGEPRTV